MVLITNGSFCNKSCVYTAARDCQNPSTVLVIFAATLLTVRFHDISTYATNIRACTLWYNYDQACLTCLLYPMYLRCDIHISMILKVSVYSWHAHIPAHKSSLLQWESQVLSLQCRTSVNPEACGRSIRACECYNPQLEQWLPLPDMCLDAQ